MKFVVTVLLKGKTTSYTLTAISNSDAMEKIEKKIKGEWDEISAHPEGWKPSEELKETLNRNSK